MCPCRDEIAEEEMNKMVKIKMKTMKIDDNKNEIDGNLVLSYPPSGVGAISITIKDYEYLACDEYLNDKIIDFYIQYLLTEVLTEQQRTITHIFSTFFYEVLTTPPRKDGATSTRLNAGQKRYERVKKWTKNVNLFEKDYVIVPINESNHWFLVIICFPGLSLKNNDITSPQTANTIPTKRSKTKANANKSHREGSIENADEFDVKSTQDNSTELVKR